jgi:hypothetical protein
VTSHDVMNGDPREHEDVRSVVVGCVLCLMSGDPRRFNAPCKAQPTITQHTSSCSKKNGKKHHQNHSCSRVLRTLVPHIKRKIIFGKIEKEKIPDLKEQWKEDSVAICELAVLISSLTYTHTASISLCTHTLSHSPHILPHMRLAHRSTQTSCGRAQHRPHSLPLLRKPILIL